MTEEILVLAPWPDSIFALETGFDDTLAQSWYPVDSDCVALVRPISYSWPKTSAINPPFEDLSIGGVK